MNFLTDLSKAATPLDSILFNSTAVTLRMIRLALRKQKTLNAQWKLRRASCHSVARFISNVLPDLTLVHGFVVGVQFNDKDAELGTITHSWLRTPHGAIIDPYPMGVITIGGPVLIPHSESILRICGENLYREDIDAIKLFDVAKHWRIADSWHRVVHKHISSTEIDDATKQVYMAFG